MQRRNGLVKVDDRLMSSLSAKYSTPELYIYMVVRYEWGNEIVQGEDRRSCKI